MKALLWTTLSDFDGRMVGEGEGVRDRLSAPGEVSVWDVVLGFAESITSSPTRILGMDVLDWGASSAEPPTVVVECVVSIELAVEEDVWDLEVISIPLAVNCCEVVLTAGVDSGSGEDERDGGSGCKAGSKTDNPAERCEPTSVDSESERSDSSEELESDGLRSFRMIAASRGFARFQHRLHANEFAPSSTSTSVNWRNDSTKPFSPKDRRDSSGRGGCVPSEASPDVVLCKASERRSHPE